MNGEPATVPKILEECSAALAKAGRLGFLVRNSQLQKNAIEELTKLKRCIKAYKAGAVQVEDERSANTLFNVQCVLNAFISLLRMWIMVKGRDYHQAWNLLIDAEEYVALAQKASTEGFSVSALSDHLRQIEHTVFPGFTVFNSWGAVIRGGKCTICSRPFAECDHIEGKVYSGRLCVRIHPEVVEFDHSSLVEQPRDRRCIMTEIPDDDGGTLDVFTLKQKRKAEPLTEGVAGHGAGVLFSNRLIEID